MFRSSINRSNSLAINEFPRRWFRERSECGIGWWKIGECSSRRREEETGAVEITNGLKDVTTARGVVRGGSWTEAGGVEGTWIQIWMSSRSQTSSIVQPSPPTTVVGLHEPWQQPAASSDMDLELLRFKTTSSSKCRR